MRHDALARIAVSVAFMPMCETAMVARSCIKCGEVIARGSRCELHKPKPAPKKPGRPYKSPEYQRNRALMIEDVWTRKIPCWICGENFASRKAITADHILPVSKGGTNELRNLAPAHFRCNSARGAACVVLPAR